MKRKLFRFTVMACCLTIGIAMVLATSFAVLNRAYPSVPLLAKINDYSVEVVDRHGDHLRIFTNGQDRWRLKTELTSIDPNFQQLLVAYS